MKINKPEWWDKVRPGDYLYVSAPERWYYVTHLNQDKGEIYTITHEDYNITLFMGSVYPEKYKLTKEQIKQYVK